jgi:hypothetical protein
VDAFLKILYERHRKGALVRSWSSLVMWLFALFAFYLGTIKLVNIIGVTSSVLGLVLMNPPLLWALKRTTTRRWYTALSLFINFIEVLGYTSVIYFLGGIQANYLISIYFVEIFYVGVIAQDKLPFIIASICSVCYCVMVGLQHFGFLPLFSVISVFYIPWKDQILMLIVIVAYLYVAAFIASYAGSIIKRNKQRLREQNEQLQKSTESLQLEIEQRRQMEVEREALVQYLQKALSEVKTLSGFIPICASCKKIRDDKGFWNQIEAYIRDHTEAEFSHGICPDCEKKLYGDILRRDQKG